MGKDEASLHFERIVLGVTCYADTVPAIDLAVTIAQVTHARLEGLLLEEDSVFQLGSMPSAKAVQLRSGRLQQITSASMQDAFNRDAETFRKRLESVAQKATIEWGFERRQGNMDSVVEHSPSGYDIVLLGFQQPTYASPTLLVVSDARHQHQTLIQLAHRLSEPSGLQVEELAVEMDAKGREAAVTLVLDTLANRSLSAVVLPVSLARAIGVERLLYSARCPLIIHTGIAEEDA